MTHAPSVAELFEAIPLRLAVLDTDLRVSSVNRSWRETLSLDPRGRPFEELFGSKEDFPLDNLRHRMREALEGRTQFNTSLLLPPDDNSNEFPLALEVCRLRTEEPRLLLVVTVLNEAGGTDSAVNMELLLNSITERIIFHDRDMRIIWANRVALDEAKMANVDEIIGRHCYEIWAGGTDICEDCPVMRAIRDKREVSIIHSHEDERRTWSIRAFPVHGRDGESVIGAVETAMEITELQRTEEALRESEYWYRTTLEGISDGVIVTDHDGCIIICNPEAERLTGWPECYARDKDIRDVIRFVHGQTRLGIPHPFDTVMERGESPSLTDETMLVNRDERLLPVEASGIPLSNGGDGCRGFILVLRDVSEKRRFERDLRSKERQYRTLAQNAPDVITRFDRRIRLIFGNKALFPIAGVAPAMAHERTPKEMNIDENLAHAWEESLRDCLYHRERVTRNAILGGGNTRRTLVIESLPEFDESGDVESLLSVIRDASPIDRIARNLSQKNRLLEIMNEAVSRFAERPHDEVTYRTVAHYLQEITGARIAFVCSMGEESSTLRAEAFSASGEIRKYLRDSFGSEVEELTWNMDLVTFDDIQRGSLVSIRDVAELTGESVPRDRAAQITRDLQLGEIFAIALAAEGRMLGIMGFAMPTGVPLENSTMVEAYSHVVSGTLRMREMERALRASEEQYRSLAEAAGDGILIVREKIVEYTNERFASMVKRPANQIVGSSFTAYFHHDMVPEMLSHNSRRLAGEDLEPLSETTVVDSEGREIPVEVNVRTFDYQGERAVLAVIRDITERKRVEQSLKYVNLHDQLTGLYNRAYFEDSLRRLNVPRQLPLGVIVGDVNGLKIINDGFGTEAGNGVLRSIAQTLKENCRAEDIVARIGSDEFGVLLPETDETDTQRITDRIRNEIAKTQLEPIPVTVSLGWATKDDPEEDIEAAMSQAEEAMYRDKMLEMSSVRSSLVTSLTETLRATSMETESHAERMENMALALGRKLHLEDSELANLAMVARLHDIGKVGVPSFILRKPGKLTNREWNLVQKHPEIGARIASSLPDLAAVAKDIKSHHERWDGTGYPAGLAGEDIPLIARIISVVDAFDVMISGRPYQGAKTIKEALEEIRRCAGTQFDPRIAESFIDIVKSGEVEEELKTG